MLPALAAGVLSAGSAPAAQAAAPAPARLVAARSARPPSRLSAAQAATRAKATGKQVVASALTTPTSLTTAHPNGSYTLTPSLQPVRAWRRGAWLALNPDLHANANAYGIVTPDVTTGGIALSGGGTAPLAVLTSAGRTMSVSWPGKLPVPTLSGDTATYSDVLPGVDLVVTVTPQGGFSDVLIIKNAAAAASPRLDSIRLAAAAPGLHITATAAGNLTVAASPQAEPVFTALAPQMWDSTGPPAGVTTVREADGTLVAASSGLPAHSSAVGPGVGARTSRVAVSVAGNAITLTPARSGLTGSGIVYPVYIDPKFLTDPVGADAADWTQVDSGTGFTNTSYWNEGSDLQLGQCDNSTGECNGIGKVRFFLKMPISSELTTTTHVDSADLYMTDVWSDSCTPESVQMWLTGGISSATTWANQPSWNSQYASQPFAYGYPGCGSFKKDVTWDITSRVQADAGLYTNQTFGFKAGSESDTLYWKQFSSGRSNITMSTTFHSVPSKPKDLNNAPAGACKSSHASEATIGNDDVTLSAVVGDIDNIDGDGSLTTAFVVRSYPSGTAVYSTHVSSGNAQDGTMLHVTLSRATILSWNSSAASYYWYAWTQDDGSPVLTGPSSADCYFAYNPLGPAAPGVVLDPASGASQIGTTISATFSPPTGCSPSTLPCPTSYTYQVGVALPVTVTPNNSPASGDWTGNIPISRVGPAELTVYGTAAGGNPGTPSSAPVLGTAPVAPYLDGYFTGGSYPSVLTLGTGHDPSLWLSVGSGNGALEPPVDIGSLGTGINLNADGPGDWAGAQVLHGDFTANGVQDVMAYYPATGKGVIIGGTGDPATLVPDPENTYVIPGPDQELGEAGALSDPSFANPNDSPTDLVAAGNASELCAGADDLIGILGDATSGYELDLFSIAGTGGLNAHGQYGFDQLLSTTAPDGTADWGNYALATAQPGDSSDQTGCANAATEATGNPDNVVLLALDKVTGALYESTNPTLSATTPVGSGNWTTLTDPWGSTAPHLVSADVDGAGYVELWTLASGTVTPYFLSGGTVSYEGVGTPDVLPADDWQLTDGNSDAQPGTSTATDSITGTAASMIGSYSWEDDDFFDTVSGMDGVSSYITPPAGTVPSADFTPSLSIWFSTSTPLGSDGVLASLQASPLSSGSSTSGGYDPVMYVGTDGMLHAEWYQGSSAAAIISLKPVNDGLWHHALLSTVLEIQGPGGTHVPTYVQTLTIDGVVQGTATGQPEISGLPDLDFGAGYIGGHWADETHSSSSSGTGYRTYFDGEIADITFTQ